MGLPRNLILLLALLAGLSIATLRTAAVDAPRLAEPMTVLLRGDVLKVQETRSGKRLVLRVREVDARANTDARFANRVRLRIPADARIAPGDWINVRARLFPPMGPVVPGGYDFSFRAYFDGIGASGFSYGAPEIVQGPARNPTSCSSFAMLMWLPPAPGGADIGAFAGRPGSSSCGSTLGGGPRRYR
jgi:competence protein ComEC